MSALNNQTNRNANRYFFATAEGGEQTLGLQYGTTGGSPNLSTMAVTISGPGGNGVIVNTAPSYQATDYIFAEQGMGVYGSTYFTPSTLATSVTGINLSSDRIPGSGLACIEAYSGNGSQRGFEFVSRGVDGVVVSSINVNMNNYVSTIGKPGASATIGGNGECYATNSYVAPFFTSLNAQPTAGGRPCYGIQDLSGAEGVTPEFRWAIGTSGVPVGGNAGSDLTFFSYNDDSSFNSSPLIIKRSDGAMAIQNISSIQNQVSTATFASVFPCSKDNTEFGIGGANNTATITGNLTTLFSTPVSSLNPITQTLLNINFVNALSSGSGYVTYKVGFSTATAYTNVVQTAYLPGGGWTPGGAPSTLGATNICCILDPDGLNPGGDGFLYVAGATLDGSTDTIYLEKGPVSEPTRHSLNYRPV
jgi:hypothetical protein